MLVLFTSKLSSLSWMVLSVLLAGPTPTPGTPSPASFPEVKTWAVNVTSAIQLFGYSIAGGAFAVGFIMLMFSWGNERREATAKSGLMCAALGVAGLLATTIIQAIIGRVVGAQFPH